MMMPRRLLHSAHIAVGVLAMLVVALSSELPAFQESAPHPVDGKTQIFQAGNQAGQQAAKSETDAKLSKAIEAAQQQQKIAEAAQQAAKSETDAKLSKAAADLGETRAKKNAAQCAPEGALDCAGLAPVNKYGSCMSCPDSNKYESCPDSLIKGQYFFTKAGTKKGKCYPFDHPAAITRNVFSNGKQISGKTVITKAGIWKVNMAHKAVGAIAMKRLVCAKETRARVRAGSPTLKSCEMFVASRCIRCPNFQFADFRAGWTTKTELKAFYSTCVKVAFNSTSLKADFECNAADMVQMAIAMAAF